MPMYIESKKREVFKFLVDRVEQKLQSWRMQNISKAGKITLLKSAAQAVPNFWMQLFLIPQITCDAIEKRMNSYWWGSGTNGRGIKWMSWSRLAEVKEGGGLGFKKLREFNLAMIAKQAWRLLNNLNPLVTTIMKARYYRDTDFLNANLGVNPSYTWRSIMVVQENMKQGSRRKIIDGQDTRVWKVPWLPCRDNGYVTIEEY
ncbi:putative mitochondrial protein AtMg00310 [Apium graveolens]|uniref:putative mitochondrial protein AtMg00310 n=1 Tax=Apium graveolens TaxID=4045 RepID=UPI003D7A06B0